MTKYLAIYYGAASQADKEQMSPAQIQAFMAAWSAWATRYRDALVDPGSPLAGTKRVTADGITDLVNNQTGYSIVQAESHDAAAGSSPRIPTWHCSRATPCRSWSVRK